MASAQLFAERGAKVAVTDIDGEAVQCVRKMLIGAEFSAMSYALDVADPITIKAVINRAAEAMGGLDVVINNAGFNASRSFTDEVFLSVFGAKPSL